MILLVAAALVLLSVGVVAYPFLKNRFPSTPKDKLEDTGTSSSEVEAALDAIRTLQLEHQLGNVPEELYQEQLRDYRVQAAASLRKQVEGVAKDADRDLEQEIMLVRLGAAVGTDAGAPCPACGAVFKDGNVVCGACGAAKPSAGPDSRRGLEQ